ncbi:P47 [Rachiplusia nu nucleopolyhedrovirus]|uniref:P47 n=1 Tax=Rachiplusia nu nucleopolyhedrovirus TaxID=2605775 RepID=A0AAE6M5Q0_9ABAC|nr:P47 [Rachiplusia nu nucleopolyhedrovirus]QEI03654.1 P47 [Rachiplusia nu nucleopolyhedrovirus]
MEFARYFTTCSQLLPQCCKYLAPELSQYLLFSRLCATQKQDISSILRDDDDLHYVIDRKILVNDEGFIQIEQTSAIFNIKYLRKSCPRDLMLYVKATRESALTEHDLRIINLLVCDRWYKGDFERLQKILQKPDLSKLIKFTCNVMWERGYEDHYTLGQQLSVRITTKLIQSGLDFKHQQVNDGPVNSGARGWQSKELEKLLGSITSLSDVIKRHKHSCKFIVLELVPENHEAIKDSLRNNNFKIIENSHTNNVCVIQIDEDKCSFQYLIKLKHLFIEKQINLLFVTDVETYLKQNNFMFYLYNSLKLYYYCLCNKFVFEEIDYEMIILLYIIVALEWHNNGHLNSFTLEKSEIYNPLELSTRRLNSIKRAAAQSRVLCNDNEIKVDFIKGKRIKTGTHYGHRILDFEN